MKPISSSPAMPSRRMPRCVRRSRPIIGVFAMFACTLVVSEPVSAEPLWWTQQKQTCHLDPSLNYNTWAQQGYPCNRTGGGSGGNRGGYGPNMNGGIGDQNLFGLPFWLIGKAMQSGRGGPSRTRQAAQAPIQQSQDAVATAKIQGLVKGYAESIKGGGGSGGLDFDQRAGSSARPSAGLDFMPASPSAGAPCGAHAGPKSGPPLAFGDPSIVDARCVPSGLPRSVESQIPHTPAGDRVRKGFEAIADHDWKVAIAWFEDAQNQEPGNAGIARLVDLARYTYAHEQQAPSPTPTSPPNAKAGSSAEEDSAYARATAIEDEVMNEELSARLDAYNQSHPSPSAALERAAATPGWGTFFSGLFKRPPRVLAPTSVAGVRD